VESLQCQCESIPTHLSQTEAHIAAQCKNENMYSPMKRGQYCVRDLKCPIMSRLNLAQGYDTMEITAPYYVDRLRRQFPPSSRSYLSPASVCFCTLLLYFPHK
jgi:hypothetical protein